MPLATAVVHHEIRTRFARHTKGGTVRSATDEMRIGLDIGGTKIDAVALDPEGRSLAEARVPTEKGQRGVVESTSAALDAVTRLLPRSHSNVGSIGVGVPGTVDVASGQILNAVNLDIVALPLGALLRERFHVPVTVDNDVNAAALGSSHLLASRTASLSFLNVGTGLAAGFVKNGEIDRGARGIAGEIGHIVVRPDGALCGCGQRGCLESFASGRALATAWPDWGPNASLPSLLAAEAAGNVRAIEVLDGLVDGVATAVQILALIADHETILLGGGVAQYQGIFERVVDELHARREGSVFMASLNLDSRVGLVPDDRPIAATGAALLCAPGMQR